MFTGIVRELGTVSVLRHDAGGARVRVEAALATELREGGSVAVNGACLTVADLGEGWFEADVMNQTLALTTLGDLELGARVNVEPALRAGEPLGGHLVQGHVDAVAEVLAVGDDGIARRLRVRLPGELGRYVAERGSLTLDGVSLTVAALDSEAVEVSLVPETLERTTLGAAAAGTRLNAEVDVIARYVEAQVQGLRK